MIKNSRSENCGSDCHQFLFLLGGQIVQNLALLVGQILQILLQLLQIVLGDLALLLGLLEGIHSLTADVTDGNLAVLAILMDLLGQLLTAFLSQLRECQADDSAVILGVDAQIRGLDSLLDGTQQSGDAFELNIANLATDTQIMELTRNDAIEILHSDPMLERRENLPLRALRDRHHKREKIDFSDIS